MAFAVKSVRILSGVHRLVQSSSLSRNTLPKALSVRCTATASGTLQPPNVAGSEKKYPAKVTELVDQIARLTLLEVADLNELLRKTLGVANVPLQAAVQSPAASQTAKGAKEKDEVASAPAKTNYTVKLIKYDDAKKIGLIKEIKTLVEGMNLVQAKKFVESVPQSVKTGIGKDEAEKLKKQLEGVGAVVEIS